MVIIISHAACTFDSGNLAALPCIFNKKKTAAITACVFYYWILFSLEINKRSWKFIAYQLHRTYELLLSYRQWNRERGITVYMISFLINKWQIFQSFYDPPLNSTAVKQCHKVCGRTKKNKPRFHFMKKSSQESTRKTIV